MAFLDRLHQCIGVPEFAGHLILIAEKVDIGLVYLGVKSLDNLVLRFSYPLHFALDRDEQHLFLLSDKTDVILVAFHQGILQKLIIQV
ncbi:hypothetical protein D3C87_1885690 [compost metagenome]